MSAFWSMFWFKPFRNFLRKIVIFRNFNHWSEILSMSAGRPLSQGVCPPLVSWEPNRRRAWALLISVCKKRTRRKLEIDSFIATELLRRFITVRVGRFLTGVFPDFSPATVLYILYSLCGPHLFGT
jgi:hypothetical protein